MNKKAAMRMLYDDETEFKGVNPRKKWPLEGKDTEKNIQNMKNRHLACILHQLEADILALETAKDKNKNQQKKVSSAFQKYFQGDALPNVSYAPKDPQDNAPTVYSPTLAFKEESRMESINRCWNILRYLRYCRQATGMWEQKFSQKRLEQGSSIDKSYIPHWLLPVEKNDASFAVKKCAAVLEADKLTPKIITVIWDQTTEFEGSEELNKALEDARAKNLEIPDSKQVLIQDPRLCLSAAAFRDAIRRQYNCSKLLMDIRSIRLTYSNPAISNGKLTRDILRGDWKETKSTFTDDTNINLVLYISFEALDDPEQNIIESFELPPEITGFFRTDSNDVAMNDKALADIAETAFNTEQDLHTSQPQLSGAGASLNQRELPSFVELAFTVGRGPDDIGSAPDPKEKFPAEKDFKALLKYYDNYNVLTEEGKRKWQLDVLAEITSNARVASIKRDKLPKDISQAQKGAIEEGELRGQYAAMGEEAKEEDTKV